MHKRERLEKTIAGESVDRLPVMLYRHWPGDDQRAGDLAHALVAFQSHYDWDCVVAMPASNYHVIGYGLQDAWMGALNGTRHITKNVVQKSLDWTTLRTLDPLRGPHGIQLECLRLLGEAFAADETPFLQVIYNPLGQAARLAGRDAVMRHMRTEPDRLRTGLNTLTESTLRLIDAMRRTSVSGLLYVTEFADYSHMAEDEYAAFGVPYDQKILDSIPARWWLNMVHIPASAPMLQLVSQYPVQVWGWQAYHERPTLEVGRTYFPGAVCGGLAVEEHLHNSPPSAIRAAARAAWQQTDSRRLIVSAEGPVHVTTPLSNMRAVRDIIEQSGMKPL